MAVISMNLSSGCLRMKTDVMVILPFYSPYDIADGKRDEIFPVGKKYQVLWLLNGGNGNDWDYVTYSNIVRYAYEHMLAVVMPSGYNMNYDDFEPGMKMCKYIGEELPNLLRKHQKRLSLQNTTAAWKNMCMPRIAAMQKAFSSASSPSTHTMKPA